MTTEVTVEVTDGEKSVDFTNSVSFRDYVLDGERYLGITIMGEDGEANAVFDYETVVRAFLSHFTLSDF